MTPLDKKDIEDIFALTPMQEGMLFHYLKNPQSDNYFEQLSLEISGKINREYFEKAWKAVVDTNEMLRVVFRWEKVEKPIQITLKKHTIRPTYYDLSDNSDAEAQKHLEEIKKKDKQKKFNLEHVPFRVTLCKIKENKFQVIISNHHILYDGWSNAIILKEFFDFYHDLINRNTFVKPAKVKFKEFVKAMQSQDKNCQETFWKKYLQGFDAKVEIPVKKRERAALKGVETYLLKLSKDIKDNLEVFVKKHQITLVSLLYSAWGILLRQYCNSSDVIFGTTVSGRSLKLKRIEDVVGLFINTLPLRVQNQWDETVEKLVHRINDSIQQRQAYETTPLVDIKAYSELDNKEELFDTIIIPENYPLEIRSLSRSGSKTHPLSLSVDSYSMVETTHYDLAITVTAVDILEIRFIYNSESYDKSVIQRMGHHFRSILEYMITNPGEKITGIEMVSTEEKRQILFDFNDTDSLYPDKMIHEIFAEQAERLTGFTALHGCMSTWGHREAHITYCQLHDSSNRLAYLLREKGVQVDTVVGIMMERSIEMVIGILGILKAGAAYLPIVPQHPEERIKYILDDSNAEICLTSHEIEALSSPEAFNNRPKGTSSFGIWNLEFGISPQGGQLAYIIYTSGSTGKPKGVMVEHVSVINTLWALQCKYPFREPDVYLLKTAFVFDVSVTELFGWFFGGGRLEVLERDGEKDPQRILNTIARTGVTHINFVPSMFNEFIDVLARENPGKLSGLKYIFLAGEVLLPGLVKRFRRLNTNIILENIYGPTEAAVYACWYSLSCWQGDGIIPIGKPLPNVKLYIYDKNCYLQPVGIPGELYISGVGVARGYLNRPVLTAEKFDQDLWDLQDYHDGNHRSYRSYKSYILYRTGDLGRWLPDGNIEFLGRLDHQVKIRGFRIELGEIENHLLTHKHIKAAVVVNKGHETGGYLCAYIVTDTDPEVPQLKEYLSRRLPGYMVPSFFVFLEKIPLTPSGKINRSALPEPSLTTGKKDAPPRNKIEKKLLQLWQEVLGFRGDIFKHRSGIGINDNFFDVGGNSLSLIRLSSRINRVFQRDIPMVTLFRYPSIASQAEYLSGRHTRDKETPSPAAGERVEIAVIGMACRFPGAKTIREFWNNLKNGVESIAFLTLQDLERSSADGDMVKHPGYIPAKGVLENNDHFDAFFFEYTAAEAEIMDPQVRIFHECCWEALEDASYAPGTYDGAIGLYAGASPNPYWEILPLKTRGNDSFDRAAEQWNELQFSNKDYLSTRIAYKLDLTGPCAALQTACSTSLSAISFACQGLLSGDCDMALAGGVSVSLHDEGGYLYQEGLFMSPDGHCRAFAAEAGGTVNGNGAGVVVLKPLQQALSDRDHIYAVIKGFGINNDGKNKIGFTAPSVEGQSRAIRAALRMARIKPESIGYVETHGTGTKLGDPIEIEGLKQAFFTANTNKKNYCALGSVKTNIGHLESAAGIAGLIKAALAIKHRLIPPSLHFQEPNPNIHLEDSPFYVNRGLTIWKNENGPLRAGVSSFGIGGTNVHVILEAPPHFEGTGGLAPLPDEEVLKGAGDRKQETKGREYRLIILSAKTPTALDKMTENLAFHFKENPALDIGDAAYTLQIGRKAFPHREMVVCSTKQEAVHALESHAAGTDWVKEEKPTVIFMFSGQGSEYVNMGLDLYQRLPIFRSEIDGCFQHLEKITDKDMKHILFPGDTGFEQAENKINQLVYASPIKFIFEYSLARLLMEWGIKPDAMIGHSFGEYVAACLSGVFSVEQGIWLAVLRGELIHSLPDGAMLSAPLPEAQIKPMLTGELSLAAVNGESLCVVSGSMMAVNNLEKKLNKQGTETIRLRVPRAGHSWMMDPILEEFHQAISRMSGKEPQIPYISGLTGKWITPGEAVDPGYWTSHMRHTIRFSDGLTTLLEEPNPIFLQISPGRGLTQYVQQHPGKSPETPAINMVRHPKENVPDVYYTLDKIGQLWLRGVKINWPAFYTHQTRSRVSMPTYPFESIPWTRPDDLHSLEFKTSSDSQIKKSLPGKKADISDWFYMPSWKHTLPLLPNITPSTGNTTQWNSYLVFTDHQGIGQRLVKGLEQKGHKITTVSKGASFKKITETLYSIHPASPGDYHQLIKELQSQNELEQGLKILHLWSIEDTDEAGQSQQEHLDRQLQLGFYSLLYLVKGIGGLDISHDIFIDVVTSGAHEITGRERLYPAAAAVLGPVKVIPQEYPNIRCRNIDIASPAGESGAPGNRRGEPCVRPNNGQKRIIVQHPGEIDNSNAGLAAEQLLLECTTPAADSTPVIAYRDRFRWVREFNPFPLPRPAKESLPLRQEGVYWITGGLGDIGVITAQYLAESWNARLALSGRSFFPAKSQWNRWLETHPGNDDTSFKIRKLQEIETTGARVLVLRADTANSQEMEKALARIKKTFGILHGVIHCAGVIGKQMFRTIKEISDSDCRDQFRAKVYGPLVLKQVLKDQALDFCLFMSSNSSSLGGLGFAAYSAANLFMDAFVYLHCRTHPGCWMSIDWDTWKTRKSAAYDFSARFGIEQFAILPGECAGVLERLLSCIGMPQVIVSTGELSLRLQQWIKPAPQRSASRRRPALSNPYIAPNTPLEQTLSNIWSELLGFEEIGIQDNFFELGGDSLKAVTAISKIHKSLEVKIPLRDFFARPVIKDLAQIITNAADAKEPQLSLYPCEEKEYYNLSPAQQRMFVLHRMKENNIAYNTPVFLEIQGQLNRERFQQVFRQLIRRHESLRTFIAMKEEAPIQRIHHDPDFSIEYYDKKEVEEGGEDLATENTEKKNYKLQNTMPLSIKKAGAKTNTNPKSQIPNQKETKGHHSSFIIHHSFIIRPFDLSRVPLLRVGLIRLAGDKYIFIMDIHHIVTDGISVTIIVKELIATYNGEELAPLRLRYRDFFQGRHWHLPGEKDLLEKQRDYWLQEFAGEIPVLDLPLDFERPMVQNFEGSSFQFEINSEETTALKALASEQGITLYMLLLALFSILLAKLSGQEDIIIGAPVHGREHPDLKPIVGMFVNTLALRCCPRPKQLVKEFLSEIRQHCLKAFENQEYQFENLVDQVMANRDPGRHPLFDAMFTLHNIEMPILEIPGLKLIPLKYEYKREISRFDLALEAVEKQDHLLFIIEYCTHLFKDSTIQRFIDYFRLIVTSVLKNPGQQILEIEIIPEQDKKQILEDFNDTAREFPRDKTILDLFREHVERTPDYIALVGENSKYITYRELNEKSSQLALWLREKGIRPDIIAAVMIERSVEMIVGILGILKAGGAYLPIDPDYPQERIDYMLKDSNARILLKKSEIRNPKSETNPNDLNSNDQNKRAGVTVLNFEPLDFEFVSDFEFRASNFQVGPANLAYVIYTSGSTGRPKGTLIEHGSLVNFCSWTNRYFRVTNRDRAAQYATFGFDASVWEIFPYLIAGASIHFPDHEVKMDIHCLKEYFQASHITVCHLPTQVCEQFMLTGDSKSSLRLLLTGGDKLRVFVKRSYALYNNYGPTENTVITTSILVDKHYPDIPIGKPISNTRVYILNKESLRLQPIGLAGELCISGAGLTRGYLNNPELTAEKFCLRRPGGTLFEKTAPPGPPHKNFSLKAPGKNQHITTTDDISFFRQRRLKPVRRTQIPLTINNSQLTINNSSLPPIPPLPHSPIYLSGDLALWLPDGNIRFLGRIDRQVKIRGYRIELEEIQKHLLKHEKVKEAVVIAREHLPGSKYLCAYIVPVHTGEEFAIELREFLAGKLPAYMIPTFFLFLAHIPLTPNGKIDQDALPEPSTAIEEADRTPRDEIEEILAAVWSEILGGAVGINDNFFQRGGDSIKAIQVAARLRKYNLKLAVTDLFLYPSIKELGACVRRIKQKISQDPVTGNVQLTPIQQWFFQRNFTGNHHFNQAIMLYGKQDFNQEFLSEALRKLIIHHDALRMVFKVKADNLYQENRDPEEGKLFDLYVMDLKDKNRPAVDLEMEKQARQIQQGMDLQKGPLIKLGLFKTGKGDYLLIVIHHLVVDGISWRILLEDLAVGYQQAARGEEVRFQEKTDSYQHWAQRLKMYAETKPALEEVDYWRSIEETPLEPLPRDYQIEKPKKINKNLKTLSINLNQHITGQLLEKTNRAYNTEINDILLTALALAVQQWTGMDKILINLEGHGREPIIKDIDISRTIGWFTSQYPVLLDMSQAGTKSPGSQIKFVKETLRKIPNKGVGYGILKYLTPVEKRRGLVFKHEPGIAFNYLGQAEPVGRPGNRMFQVLEISSDTPGIGASVSPDMEQMFTVAIDGILENARLKLVFSYNQYEYRTASIEILAARFRDNLIKIIQHCCNQKQKEITPSDVGYNKISLDELEQIRETLGKDREIQRIYPPGPMQAGMLFHALKDNPDTGAYFYFIQTIFSISGGLDISLLEESLNFLIQRYEVLRTNFVFREVNQPLQVVLKKQKASIDFVDISHLPGQDKVQYLEELKKTGKEKGFNLTRDRLIKLTVLKRDETSWWWVWSFHHIIMDGWCLGILYKELKEVYRALKNHQAVSLAPVTPNAYGKYVQWLQTRDKYTDEGLNYWKEYLAGYERQAVLPRLKPLEQGLKSKPAQYAFYLDRELTTGIKEIAGTNRVTVNTVFQVLWGILLQGYNNTDDVVFGTVVSGRPAEIEGIERIIGLFINTVPVRIRAVPAEHNTFSIRQLLQRVQRCSLEAKYYEYLPLAEIQALSPLKSDLIHHLLVFENYPLEKEVNQPGKMYDDELGFKTDNIETVEQTHYDFEFIVIPGQSIQAVFVYNSLVYDRVFIEKLALNVKHVVRQVVKQPGILLKHLEIISEDEKRQILDEFNNTAVEFPLNKTVYQLFAEQAEKTPFHTALVGQIPGGVRPSHLTYKELNQKSNQLAHQLSQSGVQPDTIVGLNMERSIDMVIAVLGIWKAGGAYLPMDPAYPPERINYMLADSAAKLLLTSDAINRVPKPSSTLTLTSTCQVSPANLAYIIYTSGSTGKPKGVMVEHTGMLNHMMAKVRDLCMTGQSIVSQNAPHTFDISVWQFFAALLAGGRTVIYPTELVLEPRDFLRRITRDGVTILEVVPSYLSSLLELPGSVLPLRYLLVTGEEVKPLTVKQWFATNPGIPVVNAYGPTEASDDITHHFMNGSEDLKHIERIPIGKPLQNFTIHIINKRKQLCPIGVTGEIWVSGPGIGRGYLNNPELTNKKLLRGVQGGGFLEKSPPGRRRQKIFQTGDLARWLLDGTLEFFGRKDFQVKIRGFRIEPGEIENRLMEHPSIKQAVVIAREGENKTQDKYLCAYVVLAVGEVLDRDKIREYLSRLLPGYMVPAYIVSMDRFPLTANGKVDLGALPEPSVLPVRGQGPGPRDYIEEKLTGIWAEVLGIEQHTITIDANFFQLGGHSLKVTSLVANLYKVFKVRLPIAEVFNSPTVEELAKRIKEMSASKYFSIELAEEREYYPLTPAQLRMYFLWRMESAGTAYNSFQCLVLEGELDRGQFKGVFKKLTRRHKSLRTSFEILDDEPVQRIHKEVEVEVKEDEGTGELAPLPEESYLSSVICHLSSEFIRPFDLARAPLLRVGLVRVRQRRHLLMLDMHHIITDAISMEILASDFILLYRGKALPELRLQYIDYTQWQNSKTVKTALEHQESYWLKTFAGEIPILNLPTDYARNPGRQFQDFQGSTIEFSFTEEETRELKEITLKQGITLQMFLSAVFYVLLWRLTGQEDIIIGTPAACRRHPDLERIVGLFINTLALRGFPTGIKTFTGFLQEVKTNFLQAYENQDYPFDRLVEKVVKNRKSTRERSPLLDIMFEFRGKKFQPEELPGQDPGLTMKPYAREIKTTIMDMDWFGIESENRLHFTVIYSTGLFKRERIEKMIQRFREIFNQVLAKPGIKLGDIMVAHDYAAAQSAVTRIDHGEFEF